MLRPAAVDTYCYKVDPGGRATSPEPSYHARVRKAFFVLAMLIAAGPVHSGSGGWNTFQPLPLPLPLPQLQGEPRHMPPPGGRKRGDERRRLREEVREGRLPRDEAARQYRERFPKRQHPERRRMSHEEREQMRRDIHEANHNPRKR